MKFIKRIAYYIYEKREKKAIDSFVKKYNENNHILYHFKTHDETNGVDLCAFDILEWVEINPDDIAKYLKDNQISKINLEFDFRLINKKHKIYLDHLLKDKRSNRVQQSGVAERSWSDDFRGFVGHYNENSTYTIKR